MTQEDRKITYKRNIPYYKDMPCFVNGMRLNSHPRVDKEGFYRLIIGVMVDFGVVKYQRYILMYLHLMMKVWLIFISMKQFL